MAEFKRLARLVARAFYSGEVPAPGAPAVGAGGGGAGGAAGGGGGHKALPASASTASLAGAGGPAAGQAPSSASRALAVVLIDALTRRQWVKEDQLAEDLHLNSKQVRRTLRVLEEECILKRTSARERMKDRLPDVDEPMPEKNLRTYSFCCIDYPRLLDMLRLRLHRMQLELKDALDEKQTLTDYRCSGCGGTYTDLDVVTFPVDEETDDFLCEQCMSPLEVVADDALVPEEANTEAGKARRTYNLKSMQRRYETQLKPIVDCLAKIKDTPPPDYGSFPEWYNARREHYQGLEGVRGIFHGSGGARLGGGGGGGGGPGGEGGNAAFRYDHLEGTKFEVDIADTGANGDGAGAGEGRAADPKKALPSWFADAPQPGDDAMAEVGPGKAPQQQQEQQPVGGNEQALQSEYLQAYIQALQAQVAGGAGAAAASAPDAQPAQPAPPAATNPEAAADDDEMEWDDAMGKDDDWEDVA